MNRQMTLKQYRALDIGIFTLLLCLPEVLVVLGSRIWFPGEMYTLSLTAAVCAVVMVRWGLYALIPAALGALVFCMASGAQGEQYLIYTLGNLFCGAMYLMVRNKGWMRLKSSVLRCMLYGCLFSLSMQAGRALLAGLMGYPAGVCLMFFTTDILSTLFAVLIVWITRRLDGVLEEQKHYLLRVQEEMKRERANARGMDV